MTDSSLLWSRWAEVDAILAAALEVPAAEREGLVHRAIPEPGAFRDLVWRMVRAIDDESARVSSPSADMVAGAFGPARDDEVTDLAPGTRVGAFVVGERLGRGGMATVYAAERADGAFDQRVALKVIRRGLDTEDLVRRFRIERQILSSLDHPHIARLLDGGSLADGRPWLAVELVEGEPITSHADSHRLDVRQRLTLFLGVADAVQAAHRQLVVHRDIKPSNILVDREGRVKLLDFGIAKLLDQDDGQTSTGARALTPAYASPEQQTSAPITTATDVYQLGLLLHELLTGARPTDAVNLAAESSLRPSRAATTSLGGVPAAERAVPRRSTPDRLARLLAGDLDTVVAKALRTAPEERYASAGELAADVRRYLSGLPVVAHPESASYRARKFVARHRWGVLAALLAIVLLAGYAVTLSVQNRRVAAERDRAEREADKASEVADFLVSLFHAADPNEAAGREMSARDLLLKGSQRLRDAAVDDPGTRAAMHSAIGRSFMRLGDYGQAEQQLEQAIASYRAMAAPDEIGLAQALKHLALVVRHTDARRALRIFDAARAIAVKHLGPAHPMVANILVDYSVVLSSVNPADARIDSLRSTAVALLRSVDTDVRDELANALTVWARGRPAAEAIPRMREALELRRAIHPEVHSAVAASLSDLALATEPIDPRAADSLLAEAVGILRQIHGDRGAQLLVTMNNLAAVRRDRGAFATAEPIYREVLALRREHYPEHRVALAYTLYGLGVVLTETGRADEAELHLREALAILQHNNPRSRVLPTARTALGHALTRQERFRDAERILLGVWQRRDDPGLSPSQATGTLRRLVALYEAWDRPRLARHHRQLLDSLESAD